MSHQIIEVEFKTFIRFFIVLACFYLLRDFFANAREGLEIVIVSVLLAVAIRPFAMRLERLISKFLPEPSAKRPSRRVKFSSVLAYSVVLLAIFFIILGVAPVVINETLRFVSDVPSMAENADFSIINSLGSAIGVNNLSEIISESIVNFSKNIISAASPGLISGIGTVSGVVTKIVIALIMTLFFLLEGPDLVNHVWDKLGAREHSAEIKDRDTKLLIESRHILSRMAWVVSTFVDKKVLVALVNGLSTTIFILILSSIFHLENHLALPMGMIAMVFCLIPMFGQFIGGISVSLILLLNNPLAALCWVIFYSIYSVIESNVFEPKIQGDALNLPPIVVLVAITIGTYVMGFLGTLLAIPVAGCAKVLLDSYPKLREISKKSS